MLERCPDPLRRGFRLPDQVPTDEPGLADKVALRWTVTGSRYVFERWLGIVTFGRLFLVCGADRSCAQLPPGCLDLNLSGTGNPGFVGRKENLLAALGPGIGVVAGVGKVVFCQILELVLVKPYFVTHQTARLID